MPYNLVTEGAGAENDERGRRVRPENIRSGTLFGRYVLRGSILTIKDNLNAVSGFMSFSDSIANAPTSSASGTGIYIDYTGIYGLAAGVKQFYWTAADGKGYAGAGNVVISSAGIQLDGGAYAGSKAISWWRSGAMSGEIAAPASAIITEAYFRAVGTATAAAAVNYLRSVSFNGGTTAQLYTHVSGDSGTKKIFMEAADGIYIGAVTTDKISFFGVTSVAQQSAYTQTYSTATKTHSNLTSATLTDSSGGTANQTVAAVTGTGDDTTINNNFADVTAQINKLITDLTNVKGVLNSVIDDGQAYGLLA